MFQFARMAKLFSLFLLLSCFNSAQAASDDVSKLRTGWAIAKFQTSHNQQIPKFEELIEEAKVMNNKHPNDPEIMLWYATILSSYSAIKGGMGVLPHLKTAKSLLERTIQLDSNVEKGFAHGVLGTMYARVPGWPVAFGSKEKARQQLEIAVQMDPNGSDSNYYYGDFLIGVGDYAGAKKHLEIAQKAPVRKGYEIQDRGRKAEIAASFAKLRRLDR